MHSNKLLLYIKTVGNDDSDDSESRDEEEEEEEEVDHDDQLQLDGQHDSSELAVV